MWQKTLIKYLPHLLALILLIGVGVALHQKIKQDGFREGAVSVQAKWDAETKDYNEHIASLQKEYEAREAIHRSKNDEITHALAEANRKHDVEVATLRSDYTRRLQLSSKRSAVYQRQAEAGATECRSLASHASQLDASLEEGRSLVRELRTALGLRDEQVRALSEQIKNDRNLMSD